MISSSHPLEAEEVALQESHLRYRLQKLACSIISRTIRDWNNLPLPPDLDLDLHHPLTTQNQSLESDPFIAQHCPHMPSCSHTVSAFVFFFSVQPSKVTGTVITDSGHSKCEEEERWVISELKVQSGLGRAASIPDFMSQTGIKYKTKQKKTCSSHR